MRRAARWDGIVVQATAPDGTSVPGNADVLPDVVEWLRREREAGARDGPFDVVVDGTTPADDPEAAAAIARAHAEAGATWWVEADWTDWADSSIDRLRSRIIAGPPRG